MIIKQITANKKQFLDLLLLGDEQESMIDRYLESGDLFALYDDDLKAVCVVTEEDSTTCELKNIAVYEQFQRRGYGNALIKYISSFYKSQYRTMLVGTGEVPSILSFYKRCGFELSHRIKNFFTDNYDHIIIEEGVQLIDMIYLKKSLNLRHKMNDLKEKIEALHDKDTKENYANLKELEQLSEASNSLYRYFDEFLDMIYSEKYGVRLRGYILLCKQAKWDVDSKIEKTIDELLEKVEDKKPTAVRMKLKALEDVVPYKKELNTKIKTKVLTIECSKYRDSMAGLIAKDIKHLVDLIDKTA